MGKHPERPERIMAIKKLLMERKLFQKLKQIPIVEATDEDILSAHSPKVLKRLKDSIEADLKLLDGDTFINKHSLKAARMAAGGLMQLTKAVLEGDLDNGFAIVRPPGHHATDVKSMGFCLFNNIALAAKMAINKHGLKKVLILDWDVHHGNGTQDIFYKDPSVLFMSCHRSGIYPGTGNVRELGEEKGKGFTVNVPFMFGELGDKDYLKAFEKIFIPIAKEFKPELILVSAGFDCAEGDYLGGMSVTDVGFSQFTALLKDVCPKIVLALEGGYCLEKLASGAAACVEVLLGSPPLEVTAELKMPHIGTDATISGITSVLAPYWKCLSETPSVDEVTSMVKDLSVKGEERKEESDKAEPTDKTGK